jgi:MFS family permease
MGRTILAVIAGLIIAMLVMLSVEFLSMQVSPPPPGFTLDNEADLARLVEMASPASKALVVLGWALASFLGGWVAARLSRQHRMVAALAIGVLIVIGVVFNTANIPHPLWMTVLGVLLPLPLAFAAARLTSKRDASV